MPNRVLPLLLLLLPPCVFGAQDSDVLYNQVFLQAAARRQVDNDRLEVQLAAESRGKDPAALARELNGIMARAVKQARTVTGVEVSTGAYRTYPVYRDQTIIAWNASQQLLLKSADITALSELTGQLQQHLQVKQMRFTVSPDAREKAENDLIGKAMEAFRQRVLTVQKHMDGKHYRIVNLHINTGGPPPVVYAERAMAMSKQAAPAAEAGTSTITVNVSGSVQFF